MKKLFTTISFLILGAACILDPLVTTAAENTLPEPSPNPLVTTSIVTSAGFSGVVLKNPSKNQYPEPVHYFQVGEKISTENSTRWGEAASIVAVSIQPVENRTWMFNQGDMLVTETVGRFQASVSSPGYFISVTGPDRTKVMTLTQNLKVLY